MKSFKKLNVNLLMKICSLMILIFGLDLVLKMVTIREGNQSESHYNKQRISRNKAGPNTDKANDIQARLDQQTQQSKSNHRVSKATMPKRQNKERY